MKIGVMIVSLFLVSLASACISFPTVTTDKYNISFSFEYNNESEVIKTLSAYNLSNADIEIVKNFVLEGYSVIEQTDDEYESFLAEVNEANEGKPSDCLAYSAIYKNESWTGYVSTGNSYSKKLNECATPKCSGARSRLKWNILKNDSENETSDCHNLFFIDNVNKTCEKEKFCGVYMYEGLQTFENKSDCMKIVDPKAKCFNDSDCLQEDCLEEDCIGSVISCIGRECVKDYSNGRKSEVKIMPETASAKAIERLGELNFTIELKEVGKENEEKIVYELKGEKQGKFLGIFKIMAKVQAQIDAETGDTKVIKPWWSFLASRI